MSIFAEQAFLHLQTHQPFPVSKRTKARQGFFPHGDPSKLHNCKQYIWIQPDGSSVIAAYLSPLEKGFREGLVLRHYISHLCKKLKISVGINVLARDQPWDYRIGFSSGVTMNVEIVSIIDREGFFKVLSAEELLLRHAHYPMIRIGLLKKIERAFPDQALAQEILTHLENGANGSTEIANPFYKNEPRLFMSHQVRKMLPLTEVVSEAVVSKEQKKHPDKDQTILIIDNRTTTTTLNDFILTINQLQPLLSFVSFPEIWLYTGYGGVNSVYGPRMEKKYSEFLLLPMKLDAETYFRYSNAVA